MKHFVFDVFGILISGGTHEVYKDTIDIIKELKEKGHRVYLLSNVTPYGYEVLKEKIDVSIFDHMFLSCETGLLKPYPETFKNVIDTIGDSPKNIYYFDDKERNVEVAKSLLINAYLTTGDRIKEVMEGIL